jgi:hypothetical protein
MTKHQKALCEQINSAFHQVERLCDKYGGRSDLLESVDIAARQEREHRAFGRRLGQSLRGRAPIDVCAKLFAVRGFLSSKRSLLDRTDFLAAYRAALSVERLGKAEYRALRRKLKAVAAIDYTELV